MIAIVDYDAGNIKSVEKALQYLGEEPVVTRDAGILNQADKVIVPGVGAFGDAMGKMCQYDLVEVLRNIAARETPMLGICLGLHLFFQSSEESTGVEGLSLLPGKIKAVSGDSTGFLCIFCPFLLFESRKTRRCGGDDELCGKYSCRSRAWECICHPVSSGKERGSGPADLEKFY